MMQIYGNAREERLLGPIGVGMHDVQIELNFQFFIRCTPNFLISVMTPQRIQHIHPCSWNPFFFKQNTCKSTSTTSHFFGVLKSFFSDTPKILNTNQNPRVVFQNPQTRIQNSSWRITSLPRQWSNPAPLTHQPLSP